MVKFELKIFYCLLVSRINENHVGLTSGGLYHQETSPLICSANQWISFYMIGTSVINELTKKVYFFIKFFVAGDKFNTFKPLNKNTISPRSYVML